MSLIKRIEEMKNGKRMLASARFRRQLLQTFDRALEESGLTQVELANKLGLSRSAVSQVFNGDGNLRAETISDYLFELGVHAELLLVPNSAPEAIHSYQLTREFKATSKPAFSVEDFVIGKELNEIEIRNQTKNSHVVA